MSLIPKLKDPLYVQKIKKKHKSEKASKYTGYIEKQKKRLGIQGMIKIWPFFAKKIERKKSFLRDHT